jgi:hypothetical protein
MANKTIKGVLGGAYYSGEYKFPTHSLVSLTNRDIKRILELMDKLKGKDLKGVNSLTTEIGDCSWFRVRNHDKIAKAIGISADVLSNIDSEMVIPLVENWKYFWNMVDEYSSGGLVDCVILKNSVYWKAYEINSGNKMESPCIHRGTLEKWLTGDFTEKRIKGE